MANPQESCVIDQAADCTAGGDGSQQQKSTPQEVLVRLLQCEPVQSIDRKEGKKTPSTAALTYSEVEEILSLSHKAVKHLVDTNGIPHIRFSEKRVRFPAEAFWTWYRARIKGGGNQ